MKTNVIIILTVLTAVFVFSSFSHSENLPKQDAEILLFVKPNDAKSLVSQHFFDEKGIVYTVYDAEEENNYARMMSELEASDRYTGEAFELPVIIVISKDRKWVYYNIPNLTRTLSAIQENIQ